MKNHIQLPTAETNRVDDLLRVINTGHFSYGKCIVFFENLAHLEQKLVQSRTAGIKFVAWLEWCMIPDNFSIWKTRDFADEIYDVHSMFCVRIEQER